MLDKNGASSTSTVIAAIEFVVKNKAALGVQVINLSLGHPITAPAKFDPLVQAVEDAARHDIVVVVAAGNDGPRLRQRQLAGQRAVGDHRRRCRRQDDRHARRRLRALVQLARSDVVRRLREAGRRRAGREPLLGCGGRLDAGQADPVLSDRKRSTA